MTQVFAAGSDADEAPVSRSRLPKKLQGLWLADDRPANGTRPALAVRAGRPSPRADEDPLLDECTAPLGLLEQGTVAHEVIQTLCRRGPVDLDLRTDIIRTIRRHPTVASLPLTHVQMVKRRVVKPVRAYFAECRLPNDWLLEGVEFEAGEARFDLVWRLRGGGAVLVDELKSGRGTLTAQIEAADEQVGRELRAGTTLWGNAFLGVRLLWLGDPARSEWFHPTSGRRPLCDVERWL